jgi:hypothetical protein
MNGFEAEVGKPGWSVMIHDDRLRVLKAALAADPANLALAWRYWEVLRAWQARDI